jgi:hypothetical protein
MNKHRARNILKNNWLVTSQILSLTSDSHVLAGEDVPRGGVMYSQGGRKQLRWTRHDARNNNPRRSGALVGAGSVTTFGAGQTESCEAEAEKGEGTGFGHRASRPSDFHAKRGCALIIIDDEIQGIRTGYEAGGYRE